ncbi:rod shape-determining protein [Tuwongella immobilis]|uniref:Rod shape-determining protein MreB n=1 Tax=Tuwongella immobilis TaxID=692036 RepID=A0A6C2YY81_9BACT|nr:rod shape-determining protein [Tuwongella immobilis]VIP05695.1 magnetosome protein : Putative rod shape-determining protein MreB OS=Phycisphaera mikurensis (strain NBRC 102666 / KCTC 22515 / FYK2301M01) GN=mreB PE=4 SV=1: MreB_Mbl [Tuwongella immobilis]VTS08746.1 magnetosome protein : Putative rod shape-determining protein MreB OS=Phycisphaera mikurensis (strain NBRC 102666 / KCTC 22515 / FYK2301M01) GN=mreB PE=4 SV=1: MreB_Mbl [Tuwongella immobilis]
MSDTNPIFVGMDLGTFKTSVASSTGYRDVLQTAVGWPKDHIARTMLGRDVVFGKDLVEHRLALDIVRPFEKGSLKYVEAASTGMSADQIKRHQLATRLIIEYAVARVRPEPGRPIYGVIGVPSRASMVNKRFIMEAASAVFDGIAVVSEPFTIAYGMNRLSDALVVDIGAGTTDLCPIYGVYPSDEEQVTIPLGGDHIDEELEKTLQATYPDVQASRNMVREMKERYGFVNSVSESAVVNLTINGRPRPFDITEPLKSACRVIVEPLVEAIRDMIGKFDPEFQARLRQNIILGGGGSQLKGLDRVIEQGLVEFGGGKVTKVPDAAYAGAVGALKLAMGMPAQGWTQLRASTAATASTPTTPTTTTEKHSLAV